MALSTDRCSLWKLFLTDFGVFLISLFLSALIHAFPALMLTLIFTWSELSTCFSCTFSVSVRGRCHLCLDERPQCCPWLLRCAPPKSGCLRIVSLPTRAPLHRPSCPGLARPSRPGSRPVGLLRLPVPRSAQKPERASSRADQLGSLLCSDPALPPIGSES